MPNKDITETASWKALVTHQNALADAHMRDLFADDPERANNFSLTLNGLHLDYSKNRITQETINLLTKLAEEAGLKDRMDEMFSGAHLNATEDRAVLHPALRGSTDNLTIDGEDVGEFVSAAKTQIKAISEKIRDNTNITDVISVGIGGSDLGPHMVCRALAPFCNGPKVHFVSNIDGASCAMHMQNLKPENTIIIIASKTFTTLETMRNTKTLLGWLTEELGQDAIQDHVMALTMNKQAASDMGIADEHILPLRNWIGGRYSVWSVIGLPIAIAAGYENFEKFLGGANQIDIHMREAPFEQNIPAILALIGILYRNFFHYPAHAVLPYTQLLQHLPDYLQQLDMESNGKSTTLDGETVNHQTAPSLFGAPGTNSQHAFLQALHQGTDIIPADFIVIAKPEHNLEEHHTRLLANALAQSQALMQGKENTGEPHKHFSGNRPSNTIVLDRLDAHHLGMLLAVYEYKVFVQGVIWNINSFDQYGVELGKTLAKDLINAFDSSENKPTALDSSTRNLLDHIKQRI